MVLSSRSPVALDDTARGHYLGRGVLVRQHEIVAGCVIETAFGTGAPASERNLTPVEAGVSPAERAAVTGHRGGVVWLTGLSGAGKSTLARALERELFARGFHPFLLDGDTVRSGLNTDLGFSAADRDENVRRIGEVARLLAQGGLIAIVACISPQRNQRDRIHAICGDAFSEVYVRASLETCMARDPKGLYVRAERGEIAEFTGISSPYEPPLAPALEIDTEAMTPAEAVQILLANVVDRFGCRGSGQRKLS